VVLHVEHRLWCGDAELRNEVASRVSRMGLTLQNAGVMVVAHKKRTKELGMEDRRNGDDRRDRDVSGQERRMGDRRESHRVPIEVEVREGNGPFEKHQGNIAIGGMFFVKPLSLPTAAVVQLRFVLPGLEQEVKVKAEVVEITAVGKPQNRGTRVRFIDLDIKSELSIAKYLDDHPE
jgi:hypothetical protein